MKDWSAERVNQLVVEADQLRTSRSNGDSFEAFGKYAFAHLMMPENFTATLKLAVMFGESERHMEAVRLCEFAFSRMRSQFSVDEQPFAGMFADLSASYYRIGNYEKAYLFAKSGRHPVVAAMALSRMRELSKAFDGWFPLGPIHVELQKLGCEFDPDSEVSGFRVDDNLDQSIQGTKLPQILWLRSEKPVLELTEKVLGKLLHVKHVVCTSKSLQSYFLERVPFWDQARTSVLREAPLGDQPELSEKRMPVVIFRGRAEDFDHMQSQLGAQNMQVCPVDRATPADFSTASVFAICAAESNSSDIELLVNAQAFGLIPVCSAVGSIPEYMVGGKLIKPPYSKAHVSALCGAVVSAHGDFQADGQRNHIAKEAWHQFSAARRAKQWIETVNRIRAVD